MWEAFLLAGRCGATSDPDGDDSPSPDSKPGNGNRRRRVNFINNRSGMCDGVNVYISASNMVSMCESGVPGHDTLNTASASVHHCVP